MGRKYVSRPRVPNQWAMSRNPVKIGMHVNLHRGKAVDNPVGTTVDLGLGVVLLRSVLMSQVMVWIHGGALVLGMASMNDGSILAATEDIIIVSIQYRLGILGFFR